MVMVYCEGPTEWFVIRKLCEKGILRGGLEKLLKSDREDADDHYTLVDIENGEPKRKFLHPRHITYEFLSEK